MINKEVAAKLSDLAIAPVWAKLETLDGAVAYNFLVNPDTVQWAYAGEYSKLAVLKTRQPLTWFKSASAVLSLPNVRFYTQGNSKGLKTVLDILAAFTYPKTPGNDPPILKFSYGSLTLPRVYLSSLKWTEKQWRSGICVQADGSMELLISPEPPKVEEVKKEDPKVAPLKLTDRERTEQLGKLTEALKKDKPLATRLKVDLAKDKLAIAVDGIVTITAPKQKPRTLGSIAELLKKPNVSK
jgi:hypothetical protein